MTRDNVELFHRMMRVVDATLLPDARSALALLDDLDRHELTAMVVALAGGVGDALDRTGADLAAIEAEFARALASGGDHNATTPRRDVS